MENTIIIIILAIFLLIIGFLIGLYFTRHNNNYAAKLIIDESDYLEKERWSIIFEDNWPLDKVAECKYITIKIEHRK